MRQHKTTPDNMGQGQSFFTPNKPTSTFFSFVQFQARLLPSLWGLFTFLMKQCDLSVQFVHFVLS